MRVVDKVIALSLVLLYNGVEREVRKRKRRAKEKAFINRLVSVFGKF